MRRKLTRGTREVLSEVGNGLNSNSEPFRGTPEDPSATSLV